VDSAGFHRIPSGTLSGILTMVVLWIPLPSGILSEILTDSSSTLQCPPHSCRNTQEYTGICRNPQEYTGIHWNGTGIHRNTPESTGMGPVKSSIPATVLVEYGRTWNPGGILHSTSI